MAQQPWRKPKKPQKSRQLIIKFSKIIRCKINTEKSGFRKTVVCMLPACIYVCMLCVCPMPEEAREGVRPFGTGIKNCYEKKKKSLDKPISMLQL